MTNPVTLKRVGLNMLFCRIPKNFMKQTDGEYDLKTDM